MNSPLILIITLVIAWAFSSYVGAGYICSWFDNKRRTELQRWRITGIIAGIFPFSYYLFGELFRYFFYTMVEQLGVIATVINLGFVLVLFVLPTLLAWVGLVWYYNRQSKA